MPQNNPSTSNAATSDGHFTKPRKSSGGFRSGPQKSNKNNLKAGLKGFLVVLNLSKDTSKSEKIDELYTFFEKFPIENEKDVSCLPPPPSLLHPEGDDGLSLDLTHRLGNIHLNPSSDSIRVHDNGNNSSSPSSQQLSSQILPEFPALKSEPYVENIPDLVLRDGELKSTNNLPNSAGDNWSNATTQPPTSAVNSNSSPVERGLLSQSSSSSNLSQKGDLESEKKEFFPKGGSQGKPARRKPEEKRNSFGNNSFSSSSQSPLPLLSASSTPSRRVSPPNSVDHVQGSKGTLNGAQGSKASSTTGTGTSSPNPNSPAKTLTKQQIKRKQFYQMQAATQNMPKPQLHFTKPVVNDDSPFMPKLPTKPHAIKPLDLNPVKDKKSGKLFFEHPYNVEIDRWIPSSALLSRTERRWPVKKLGETTYHVVHTLQSLNMMMRDLRATTEIAFDVEHSDRSYFGLTCLIQISTRSKDYLVDCFSLRDHLHCLNDIFTDPNVMKVAHSAHCDVTYLQKDFGVYIVGLFDTSEAEKIAMDSKQAVGLAALLTKYLNVETDKKYQLADWRIRPLPKPMVDYARSDSHFLLNLYDLQKDAIFDKYGDDRGREGLFQVYENSKEICRIRYEKPDLTDWVNKSRKHFTNQQMHALTELNNWRIRVAKKEDEGLYCIASNKTLMLLAEVLPRSRMDMIDAVRKARTGHITDFIFHDMTLILEIMENARSLPMISPQDDEVQRKVVGPLIMTQVANLVFFKAKPIRHAQVVYKIMEEFKGNKVFASPNYVQRIIPIQTTCERDNVLIAEAVRNLLLTNNAGWLDAGQPEGCQDRSNGNANAKVYEISCNFPFDKQHELISCVKNAVAEVRPDLAYTEDESDTCIIIYSISKMCGVSIVNHYRKFNEFYLGPPTEVPNRQSFE